MFMICLMMMSVVYSIAFSDGVIRE